MREERGGKVEGWEFGLRQGNPRVATLQEQKFWVMRNFTARLCVWGTEGEARALEEKQLSSVHIALAWVVGGETNWKWSQAELPLVMH